MSKATGWGSQVAKAQKSVAFVDSDGAGFDMSAGVEGMDSIKAMMMGMQMAEQIGQSYISAWNQQRIYQLQNPEAPAASIQQQLLEMYMSNPAAFPGITGGPAQ